MERTLCEVDTRALADNLRAFATRVQPGVRLAPAVKGNAYGHGRTLAARAFLEGGAHWLCVDSLEDARALRAEGIKAPIHVLGYVPLDDLEEASALRLKLVVYNLQTVARLAELGQAGALAHPMALHLKLETGNHRQGVEGSEALAIADAIAQAPGLELEGVSSHFANIEDTTDHRYARQQLARFDAEVEALRAQGHHPRIRHLSNTAAALLWPEQAFELVRLGVGAYGLWPSRETQVATVLAGGAPITLTPALTWKTRVAQVKWIPEGAYVGYGCTFMATHRTRLAILPVGYYDGYDRGLSNMGWVLIRGRRAPVRGRVCMNITMVDVTDIPEVDLEDEVVLLGRQGDQIITAEQMADWASTINYEVITRIAAHVPRIATPGQGPGPAAGEGIYRAPR